MSKLSNFLCFQLLSCFLSFAALDACLVSFFWSSLILRLLESLKGPAPAASLKSIADLLLLAEIGVSVGLVLECSTLPSDQLRGNKHCQLLSRNLPQRVFVLFDRIGFEVLLSPDFVDLFIFLSEAFGLQQGLFLGLLAFVFVHELHEELAFDTGFVAGESDRHGFGRLFVRFDALGDDYILLRLVRRRSEARLILHLLL